MWGLIASTLIFFSALGLGSLLTRTLALSLLLRVIVSITLGLGCYSFGILFLGLLGGLHLLKAGALPLLLLMAGLSCIGIARIYQQLRSEEFAFTPGTVVLGLLLLTLVLINFIGVLTPYLEVDGYAYHLWMPLYWMQEGRMKPVPYDMHSNLFFFTQMLYLLGLLLGKGDVLAPKVLQFGYSVLFILLLYAWGKELGGKTVGMLAAFVLAATQEIGKYATCTYVDLALAYHVALGTFLLLHLLNSPQPGRMLLSGIVWGFVLSLKNSGIVFLVLTLLALFIVRVLNSAQERQKPVYLHRLLLPAFILWLPWLLKNWLWTGNPFYPFLLHTFGARPEFFGVAADFTATYTSVWQLINPAFTTLAFVYQHWFLFVENIMYTGCNVAIVWFLLALLLCVWRVSDFPGLQGRFLIVLFLLYLPLFIYSPHRRFILVCIVPPLLLLSYTLCHLKVPRLVRGLLLMMLCAGYLHSFVVFSVGRNYQRFVPYRFPPPLAAPARQELLNYWSSSFREVERINQRLNSDDRLLVSSHFPAQLYLQVRFFPNPHTDARSLISILRDQHKTPESIISILRDLKVTHLLLNQRDGEVLHALLPQELTPLGVFYFLHLYEIRYP